MRLDKNTAAIDTDFISHIIESKVGIDVVIDKLKIIFSELKLAVIIHPLVYKHELMHNNPSIKRLFDDKIILQVEFEDIFNGDEDKKLYYIYLLEELYHHMHGELYPFKDNDAFVKWKKGQSLGEIHSLSMCLVSGCGYFLSDDKGSKTLAIYINTLTGNRIIVYSREELVYKHLDEGTTSIKRNIRTSLTHEK